MTRAGCCSQKPHHSQGISAQLAMWTRHAPWELTLTSRGRQRSERIEPRTYSPDASVDPTDRRALRQIEGTVCLRPRVYRAGPNAGRPLGRNRDGASGGSCTCVLNSTKLFLPHDSCAEHGCQWLPQSHSFRSCILSGARIKCMGSFLDKTPGDSNDPIQAAPRRRPLRAGNALRPASPAARAPGGAAVGPADSSPARRVGSRPG